MKRLIGKYQFLIVSILLSTVIVVAQNCDNVRLSVLRPQIKAVPPVKERIIGISDR